MFDLFSEDIDLLEAIQLEGFFNKKKLSEDDKKKVDLILGCINNSKYNDAGEIKVGSISLYCNVSFLLNTADWALFKNIENIKNRNMGFVNNSGTFNELEGLAANKISSENELIKFVSKYKKINVDNDLTDSSSSVKKSLKNKEFHKLIATPHDIDILYCYDDKCCYVWDWGGDKITKITVQQLLQASKQSYDDITKMIKEYDKK